MEDSVVYPFQVLGSEATEKLTSDGSPTVFGGNLSPKSKSPSPALPTDASKDEVKLSPQRRDSVNEKRRSRSHSNERKRSRSRSPRRRQRSPDRKRRSRSRDRRRSRSTSRDRRRSRSTSRDRRRSRSTSRDRRRRSRSNDRKHRRRRSRSPRRPRRSRSPRRRSRSPRRRRSRSPYCSKWAKKSEGLTRAVLPADGKARGSKQVSTEEVEKRLAAHMKNVKEKAAEEAKKMNLPGYLNPAMVNVHQFKQVREKRKLLWSKAAEKKSGGTWSGAFEDQSSDEKFRRLMGINENNANEEGSSKVQESRKVLDELEKEYEKSRLFQLSRGAGGVTGIGLGFGGGTGIQ